MELQMNPLLAENYHSPAQKIRVMTEHWAGENLYCPCCGNETLNHFENNRPVADFFCPVCHEEFELKSKAGALGRVINDGAYNTMIARISMSNNPNLLFMGYDRASMKVCNLMLIPRYFFVPDLIIKRKPLAKTAKRAGWTGCSIAIGKVPSEGIIHLVRCSVPVSQKDVICKVQKTKFIADYKMDARGWMLDILSCLNQIPRQHFSLEDLYQFEGQLRRKYPNNHHVREKIRQQLQVLRDKGLLDFKGRGQYQKV